MVINTNGVDNHARMTKEALGEDAITLRLTLRVSHWLEKSI